MSSHWLYKNKKLINPPEDAFGFVYLITNKKTKRKYIGRKYLHSTRRKALTAKQKREGKKRRTRVTTESNWREYMGSSKTLLADIETFGKAAFKFEILMFGISKGQVNYLEENMHHKFDVLTDPSFYNDSIGPRRYMGIKKDEEFHKKIRDFLVS